MLKTIFFIGTGGFLGSIARYLISGFFQNRLLTAFPFGTFIVNITGCLLIGIIYGFSEETNLLSPGWKMFLTAGFCGGFTTFSTFSNESLGLLNDGAFFYFFIYTGSSVFLGIAATFTGILMTKYLLS
jgi:CrcB protein